MTKNRGLWRLMIRTAFTRREICLRLLVASIYLMNLNPAPGFGSQRSSADPKRVEASVDQALQLLRSGKGIPTDRWSALRKQVQQEPEATAKVFLESLDSKEPSTRRATIDLLFHIGGRRSLDLLITIGNSASSTDVRLLALERLVDSSSVLEVCRTLGEVARRKTDEGNLAFVAEKLEILRQAEVYTHSIDDQPCPSFETHHEVTNEHESTADAVNKILREAIESSTVQLENGVRVLTRPRATAAQRNEILDLGPAGVSALAEAAWSSNPAEWEVARSLLIEIGDGRVVEPLARVVRNHPDAHRRKLALMTLVEASHFSTVVSRVAENASSDPNPVIRARAASLLAAMRHALSMD